MLLLRDDVATVLCYGVAAIVLRGWAWDLAVVKQSGAPSGTRTCNLWLRRPTLYPIELWARHPQL